MSLWEYKHITSGPHGFATPALLESYLNQLGKDEWEVINYQTLPNNPLAFNGVARRTTLRDWTLESAAASAAKVEADKLRAEFAAKFTGTAPAAGDTSEVGAEKPATLITQTTAPEDGFRKLRNTEYDGDPDAADEGDDWDNWENLDDDLPTFFEAIKPHLRKNQRGPGQSVGITFLARRWEQSEADLIGALKECGFTIPEREDDPSVHLEFEGDLYWLNLNNRHELFLNTREKPRPVFRTVAAKPLDATDPAAALLAEEASAAQTAKTRREAERLAREAEQEARRVAAQTAAARPPAVNQSTAETPAPMLEPEAAPVTVDLASLPPEADEFLAAVRAQMRRNRRGPGYSGSIPYLARAFKQSESDLVEMFAAVDLTVSAAPADKPVKKVIGSFVYWLNRDSRGGIWINGDEIKTAKTPEAATPVTEEATESVAPAAGQADTSAVEGSPAVAIVRTPEAVLPESIPPRATPAHGGKDTTLAALRVLLKPNKRGSGVSAQMDDLARTLGRDLQDFLTLISGLGLALPATEEHKPTFVEHGNEIFWLNKNPKDGSVWLNAKASKASAKKTAGGGASKPKVKRAAKSG